MAELTADQLAELRALYQEANESDHLGALIRMADTIPALVDEIERLRQDLAYVKENAEFLRSSVGECHLMISRNSSEFQTQGKQWRLSDLPARLQRIMRERETLAEAVREREEARRTAISPYRPSSEPVSETLRLERLHSEACKRDEAAHQKALALLDGGQDGGGK